ncbi:MAG: hypothetical protein ACK5Q5_12705 [Planctomycetaceae bacterium]
MINFWQDAEQRARRYAQLINTRLMTRLGAGYDGVVFATEIGSAIKSLRFEELYRRERDVYTRLWEAGIESVAGCHVPRLLNFDDELWVVEFEIVQPSFVLDFAGAMLDRPIDYPQDVLDEWIQQKMEQFGEDWPQVQQVILAFQQLGIYLADVKPGNISFR